MQIFLSKYKIWHKTLDFSIPILLIRNSEDENNLKYGIFQGIFLFRLVNDEETLINQLANKMINS